MRGLVAQFEDAGDPRRIVEFAGVRPLIRGARCEGAVDTGAQIAIGGEGQDRVDARLVERDPPALQSLVARGLREHRLVRIRRAVEQHGVRDVFRPALGRVEHGAAERIGERGDLDRHVAEAGARIVAECDAR